jgi:hypothetical protein
MSKVSDTEVDALRWEVVGILYRSSDPLTSFDLRIRMSDPPDSEYMTQFLLRSLRRDRSWFGQMVELTEDSTLPAKYVLTSFGIDMCQRKFGARAYEKVSEVTHALFAIGLGNSGTVLLWCDTCPVWNSVEGFRAEEIGLEYPLAYGLWVWSGRLGYSDEDLPVKWYGAWRRAEASEVSEFLSSCIEQNGVIQALEAFSNGSTEQRDQIDT